MLAITLILLVTAGMFACAIMSCCTTDTYHS